MPREIFQEVENANFCLRVVLYKNAVRKVFFVFFAAFFSIPVVAFAAPAALTGPLATLKTTFTGILNIVVAVLIGLAFVVFLWGIYKYVTTASLEGKAGAKETIIYGLIGLFVMLAAWGLVNILLGTFSFTAGNTVAPTTLPKAFITPPVSR